MKKTLGIAGVIALFGAGVAALLLSQPAIGKSVSAPIARPSVANTVVVGLGIRRDGTAVVEAVCRSAGGIPMASFVLPHRPSECAGIRLASDGEPEQYIYSTAAGCATAVLDAFRTTSGNIATRLDAVETSMGAGLP